jgi:phage replication O-like protein O
VTVRLCTFASSSAYISRGNPCRVSMAQVNRFVRIPTELLEAILHARLSGTQYRILLWVIRNTYGWNRSWTPFTWYRIAQELHVDRPNLYRAGKSLLQSNVLALWDKQLAVKTNYLEWDSRRLDSTTVGGTQLRITEIDALSRNNATVGCRQRNRCRGTTLFRRAKDRCKDRLKTVVGTRFVDKHGQRRIYEGNDQRPPPVEQLMDHYIALQGKAYTKNQTVTFYRRFRKSAESLLEAYGGHLQNAKAALTPPCVQRHKT